MLEMDKMMGGLEKYREGGREGGRGKEREAGRNGRSVRGYVS